MIKKLCNIFIVIYTTCAVTVTGFAQSSQNPSPMVEHIREHPRLKKSSPPGFRKKIESGTLFLPDKFVNSPDQSRLSLVIAFHCGDWIPEQAVSGLNGPIACLSINLGAGSSRYSKPFHDDKKLINRLIQEAEMNLKQKIHEIILVGWSAGYGAIREIIQTPAYDHPIKTVILLDGLHTSYRTGKPGPKQSDLETTGLEPFLDLANKAISGEKKFVFLHTEIFPGTFASTTECADWLISQTGLKRKAVLRWGPMKTQQIGETSKGGFLIQAFAGNSAPDHVDLLHALPDILKSSMETSNPITD